MTRKGILLTVAAAFVFFTAPAAAHEGDSAAQTDWSGGPNVPGPVTDWGDTFDAATNINWSEAPGELLLNRALTENVIADEIGYAEAICAADIDDDGDMDVLGAAESWGDITWWSNDDGSGTSWTVHTVDGDFNSARSVYAADVDDDGDMDILGAATFADDITWWSNDDGSGTSWTEHTVDGDFNGAYSVYAADVDDDGDIDVLGAARTADDITWWSNDDGSGTSWTVHTVDGDFDSARSVYAADVDDDGDMDILGAAVWADDITWWSNDDGSGTSWTEHTVDGSFFDAISVYAADVDDDGDIDVLGAARNGNDITWWSNDDGSGTSWTEHTVDEYFRGACSVYAADVDDDGDMDVLGAGGYLNNISWWEVTGYTPGELVSSIYDTEGSPEWGTIDWTADAPDDTTVKFRVRSSSDAGDMGVWSDDITSPGSLESYLTIGDQYVQYKAVLETTDHDVTPALEDIAIDWGYTDIAVTSFSSESAADGVELTWECADPGVGFDLYRSTVGEGKAITSRDKLNAELITGESPYSYLDAAVEEGATYSYWLEAVDVGGATETFGPVECTWRGALPTTYALHQSRPNPASGTAIIAFDLPENVKVTLTVYDINGRKVATAVDRTLPAGEHEAEVSSLAPGVYVYRLDAGSFSAARKMVVIE